MVAVRQLGDGSQPVVGMTAAASPDGFAAVITRANEVHARGYVLAGVVALSGAQIGAVFVRASGPKPPVGNPLIDDF